MNVACPQCTSVFRVDPAKVPAGGVRARCSVCSGVINVPEPSFEEPVTAATGWQGSGGSGWGRVPTPEGGWTPPPPAPSPTPPRTEHVGGTAQPRSISPSAPTAAPQPQARSTPQQASAWGTPPAQRGGGWGDWPSPTAGPNAAPAAPASADPWGDFGVNPLVPEMPSAAYSHPAPLQPSHATPPTPAAAPEEPAETWGPEADADAGAVAGAEAAISEAEPQGYGEEVGGAVEAAPTSATEEPVEERGGADVGHVNPFLRRDPHERARRLARALASDIVTYYPEKHAEGIRDGNLRELFREEIKKSYDDYVSQVGAELARSTNYFQDALNEVLAGGKRLF